MMNFACIVSYCSVSHIRPGGAFRNINVNDNVSITLKVVHFRDA